MPQWCYQQDDTPPFITAQRHIQSGHGQSDAPRLPKTAVIFEMGMALDHMEATHETRTIAQSLPCFLYKPRCIALAERDDLCFTKGGLGAPAAVDTLETLRALGVERVIVAGLCGAFSETNQVGDVIVPPRILSEEGTSRHYAPDAEYAYPDRALHAAAVAFGGDFPVSVAPTVTTDAVYRQTRYKEALWRSMGCVGVDMEASALLTVCKTYGMPAVAILLASDKHPVSEHDPDWSWGNEQLRETRLRFVDRVVAFATSVCP